MRVPEPKWYVPGSVISAFWGNVMPRLAATMWKGELSWPPEHGIHELIHGDLEAYPLAGKSQQKFWNTLARVVFGSAATYKKLRPQLRKTPSKGRARFSNGQRCAHVVLEYFDPDSNGGQDPDTKIPLRVLEAESYDFVLSSNGMDVFIPPNPFDVGLEEGRKTILQQYKFRRTGTPPIGLPGLPASSTKSGDVSLISIPQLSAPTGAYQIHEDWAKGRAGDVRWWLSGTSYRGIMAELPRIIAYKWYEEVAWPEEDETDARTLRARFRGADDAVDSHDSIKGLLEERMETRLPGELLVRVMTRRNPIPKEAQGLTGWNPRDIMITDRGLYLPDPGPAPDVDALLTAIESGQAGNPVFTDTATGFD